MHSGRMRTASFTQHWPLCAGGMVEGGVWSQEYGPGGYGPKCEYGPGGGIVGGHDSRPRWMDKHV